MLPLALRTAPSPMNAADTLDETLDALVAPIRSGVVLTYRDLAECAHQVGIGLRRGERRYALRAMVEQDARGTLQWLGAHARAVVAAVRTDDARGERPECVVVGTGRRNRARLLETLVADGEVQPC